MNTGVPSQDFPGSDLGMAVQVLENRHGRETMHSTGAGFTLVFVKLATFGRLGDWKGWLLVLEDVHLRFHACSQGGIRGADSARAGGTLVDF